MGKIYAIISVVAVLALLSCLGGEQQPTGNETNQSQPGGGTTGAATVEVNIQNNAFSQTAIVLNAGDSIKWTNLDDRIHQVQVISVTSSPVLLKNNVWTYKFDVAGAYEFRDAELPYMMGTITVS
jgi:plastocyanin